MQQVATHHKLTSEETVRNKVHGRQSVFFQKNRNQYVNSKMEKDQDGILRIIKVGF